MDCVVAPFDHTLKFVLDEVKVTLSSAQNVVGPLAVIIGAPREDP